MKTTFRTLLVGILLTTTSILSAQQVNTLYFLENAPMRHTINPAFQPVSRFYLTLPAIGYTSLWAGTNNWTMSDFVFNQNGNTITPFHPDAPSDWLEKRPRNFFMDADISVNLLGFGFAIKDFGYVHLNITERMIFDAGISSSIFGINNINTQEVGPYTLNLNAMAYTDIALGYSHKINDHWTVGGKLKVLLGQAKVSAALEDLKISSTLDSLKISSGPNSKIYAAAPLYWDNIPNGTNNLDNIETGNLLIDNNKSTKENIMNLITPAGFGAALDLGVTYKPIKQLQITASVTDLGFISWKRHAQANVAVNYQTDGLDFEYSAYDGSLDGMNSDQLATDATDSLNQIVDGIEVSGIEKLLNPKTKMLTTNLNVGIDANFWKNRIGVGVYSRTRIYNNRVTEEVTIGAALRPVNWFNLAASYSFINGRWSNIGAALSIAPYDGLMLTLATDYIPLSYAKAATDKGSISLPYKTPGANVTFGLAIVVGTNKRVKDTDKDGVLDKLDVCPNTPLNVRVDEMGCPWDNDGDGVPDYMDECPNTPSAAYGMIDTVGCPLDSDLDGVPDYRDLCPGTPAEARGHVDNNGCPLDTDGDGVYDYMDLCPNTPAAAYGMVDSVGCPLDSDGDSVYDYLDLCPDTPEEAYGSIDEHGCPLDTDKDGVYDYCDSCQNTIPEARNHVDANGCLLDTDKDGVYDYEDLCPTIAGVKENKGCPEIKREIRNLLNKAMSGIQFENGKATIKKNSYKVLDEIAKTFINNPNYMIEVQGHTDNVGKHSYNVDLSERRAQSVRTYLVNKGVPAERLTAHGYGPDKPIADNKTKAGRAKNRRVEFNISFEEVTYETIYDRVQNTESTTTK